MDMKEAILDFLHELPLAGRRAAGVGIFRPWELSILRTWTAELGPPADSILERQISGRKRVQRGWKGRWVLCSSGRRGLDPALKFPNREGDLYVARVYCTQGSDAVSCAITLGDGEFGTLDFTAPTGWVPSSELRVESVLLLHDPLWPDQTPEPALSAPPGLLPSWAVETEAARDFLPPAHLDLRTRFLQFLDVPAPDDFKELLNVTDGFRVGRWNFYGTRARQIVHPKETWILVAEADDSIRALCLSWNYPDGQLRLFDEIDDEVDETFPSMEAAWRFIMVTPSEWDAA